MKYPHRCSRCRTRRVLKRKIQNYVRPPKCKCGHHLVFDNAEYQRRLKMKPRRCDGSHYPHRKGSVLLCVYRVEPIEEEWEEMYGQG